MKKALIDTGNNRVIQIVETGDEFECTPNLIWVDCPDDTDTYYLYDPDELTFEDPHAASKDEFGNPVEPFTMQRLRAYPSLGDQLDMIYKELGDTGSLSTSGQWYQVIQEVKDAIPKPADFAAAVAADPVAAQSFNTGIQVLGPDGSINEYFNDITGTTDGDGSGAEFKIARITNYYQVKITSAGSNYAVNDTITVTGSSLGGTNGDHDATVTVTDVDDDGAILAVIIAGTGNNPGPIGS